MSEASLDFVLAQIDSARRSLRSLGEAYAVLAELERELVVDARRGGWSWSAIARDLGVSVSTAYRRHAAVDPRREELDAERRMREPPDYSQPTKRRF